MHVEMLAFHSNPFGFFVVECFRFRKVQDYFGCDVHTELAGCLTRFEFILIAFL